MEIRAPHNLVEKKNGAPHYYVGAPGLALQCGTASGTARPGHDITPAVLRGEGGRTRGRRREDLG
eukprot:326702-Hanusia_phi.AAC.1